MLFESLADQAEYIATLTVGEWIELRKLYPALSQLSKHPRDAAQELRRLAAC